MVQMISDGASAALLRVQCAFRTTGLSNFRYMKYINYSGVYVSKEPVIHTKRLKKPSPVCQESTARRACRSSSQVAAHGKQPGGLESLRG